MKLPHSLASFAASSDGQHYALGLVQGSLLVRSKKFTTELGEDKMDVDAEDMLGAGIGKEHLSRQAKDYRYFN